VGAIMTDPDGRLLLIRRGHDPGAGLWSVPGGRVERGETDAEAVIREIREETGLAIKPGRLIGSVERPGTDPETVYAIRDYAAEVIGGTLAAGDDADDARWVTREELDDLPLTPGLAAALTQWGVLPF
jgi:ADP-ribose pyrophosphatase YjhB (NUDIX family)